jgi:hypothetical protein
MSCVFGELRLTQDAGMRVLIHVFKIKRWRRQKEGDLGKSEAPILNRAGPDKLRRKDPSKPLNEFHMLAFRFPFFISQFQVAIPSFPRFS